MASPQGSVLHILCIDVEYNQTLLLGASCASSPLITDVLNNRNGFLGTRQAPSPGKIPTWSRHAPFLSDCRFGSLRFAWDVSIGAEAL